MLRRGRDRDFADIPFPSEKEAPTRITVFTQYGPVALPLGTPKPYGVPMSVRWEGYAEYWKSKGVSLEAPPEELERMRAQALENRRRKEEYDRTHKLTEKEIKQQELINLRIKEVLEAAGIRLEDVRAHWEEKERVRREEEEERARREEERVRREEERVRREEEERVRLYEESLPPAARLFPITKHLALLTPRISAEARSLVRQAKNEAAEFLLRNGYEMPVDLLARWIADKFQLHTLHANMGHLGVVAMISRIDEPQPFKCYPTGHKLQATSSELKEEPNKLLEKKMVNGLAFSYEETIQAAVDALQSVVQEDFKATEIGFSIAEHPRQGKRKLTETLPAIAGGN